MPGSQCSFGAGNHPASASPAGEGLGFLSLSPSTQGTKGGQGLELGRRGGGWSHILCAELSQETQVTADLGFVSIPGWDAFLILVPR